MFAFGKGNEFAITDRGVLTRSEELSTAIVHDFKLWFQFSTKLECLHNANQKAKNTSFKSVWE